MDKFIDLLNNSTFMGFMGVLAGGVITFLGGFVQSFFNNKHMWKLYELQKRDEKNKHIYEQKEHIYIQFLEFIWKLDKDKAYCSISGVRNQESEILNELTHMLLALKAKMQLYFNKIIFNKAIFFFDSNTPLCKEEYLKFSEERNQNLSALILLIKKDLGIEEK